MVYTRGSKHDYDDWENYGATGWSFKDVEPYFLKVENASQQHNMSARLGTEGKLALGRANIIKPLFKFINKAFYELGKLICYIRI